MAGESSSGTASVTSSSGNSHLVRFLREIPEFSGPTSLQQNGRAVFSNPLSWLKQLGRLRELAGIGDREALLIARDHLTGKAEKWYDRSCADVRTWKDFSERFKEKFCTGLEDYWWAEISNTKQSSEEDVEDIDIKLRELFSLVGVTDEKLKIRSFMDAINPTVAWEVERSENMNKLSKLEDVVNAAVRAEGIIKKYRFKGVTVQGPPVVKPNHEDYREGDNILSDNQSVKSTSTMDDLLKEFRDLKISLVKSIGNNSSTATNGSRNLSCFYCKKEGHRKIECPEFLKSKQEKDNIPATGANTIPLNSVKEVGPRVIYIDSIPSVEVYATNGDRANNTDRGGKRRRGGNQTIPSNEDTIMREPIAGPSGTVYPQVHPQATQGTPINPPSNHPQDMVNPPGVSLGNPFSGAPPGNGSMLPGGTGVIPSSGIGQPHFPVAGPSGTSSNPATNQQVKTKQKKARKPVRYLPITVRKQDIWNTLAKADAGLTVSEWLAIDKQAARELVDGLRTLRCRKKRITQDNQNRQIISANPPVATSRGTKRNAQLINTVNRPTNVAHGGAASGLSDSVGSFGSPGSVGVYGIDNLGSNHTSSDDSDSWTDSGDTTDSNISDDHSDTDASSLVTEVTGTTSMYSTINYPYDLQNMRMSAPLKAPVAVNGIVFECTFDSGASVSVMNEGLARKLGLQYNGDQMHLIGFDSMQREPCNISVDVPFRIAGHLRSEHVCIQANQRPNQKDYCILGMTCDSQNCPNVL
ncbi:hypothetical protein G6F62_009218 [Rhizopus arrhizus]|nr:hypothetical protein G6F23_010056 [Rhizopus arrhizus]KAG1324224.1 hypothetical protein G6F62_009218 [Rhizopus arrhizus]KAG1371951.1 hypothetical protein G6F61_011477 [Rhizopus arrhizus]